MSNASFRTFRFPRPSLDYHQGWNRCQGPHIHVSPLHAPARRAGSWMRHRHRANYPRTMGLVRRSGHLCLQRACHPLDTCFSHRVAAGPWTMDRTRGRLPTLRRASCWQRSGVTDVSRTRTPTGNRSRARCEAQRPCHGVDGLLDINAVGILAYFVTLVP